MFRRAIVLSSIALLMGGCDDAGNTASIASANVAPTPTPTPTPNVAPIASVTDIMGDTNTAASSDTAKLGDKLTGAYAYSDADNDVQGNSTFRWLRNGQPIEKATQKEYTLTMKDRGATLTFEVTPVAQTGEKQGKAVQSKELKVVKDALETDQWYLKNTGIAPTKDPVRWGKFTDLTKGADVGVEDVWNSEITGKGIVVTVVDDGVDFNHPDLAGREKKGFSFHNDAKVTPTSSIPFTPPGNLTANSHGTSCAGIIAAQSDPKGVLGIAPLAQLIGMGIIADDNNGQRENPEDPYKKILEDNVSQVSNHSYGERGDGRLYPHNSDEYNNIQALAEQSNNKKGHVLVFASGNGRAYVPQDYDELSVKKTFGDYAGLDMAAQHPYVISVSGFDANDKEVTYAEAGPATLIAGPTENSIPEPRNTEGVTLNVIEGADKKPTAGMATTGRDKGAYPSKGTHREGGSVIPAGFNMAFNGTSAAAPTVTGVAALLLSAKTDLSWRDVRWILAKTARKIQGGGNGETSKGIINQVTGKEAVGEFAKPFWSTGGNAEFGRFSHYFGYGAVNAKAAVALATGGSYKLLPEMKICKLTAAKDAAPVTAAAACPDTIEFVQVKYTVKSGVDVNNLAFSMTLSDVADKQIDLLVPTTCTAETGGCPIAADVSVRGGTVGFMGDTLKTGSTFNFSGTSTKDSTTIVVAEVNVFGFDKP